MRVTDLGTWEEVLKKINGWTQYSSHKLQDYFPPGVHLKFHFSERKCSWEGKCLENISYKLKVWDLFHKTTRFAFPETNINSFKAIEKC